MIKIIILYPIQSIVTYLYRSAMETFELLTLLGGIMIGMGVLLLIVAAIAAYLLGEIE